MFIALDKQIQLNTLLMCNRLTNSANPTFTFIHLFSSFPAVWDAFRLAKMILTSFHRRSFLFSNLIVNPLAGRSVFSFCFVPSTQTCAPKCSVLFISRCSEFTMRSDSSLLLCCRLCESAVHCLVGLWGFKFFNFLQPPRIYFLLQRKVLFIFLG